MPARARRPALDADAPSGGLLLDTHIWLWSLIEPERLSPEVREAIDAAGSDCWLSPISVWETLLLVQRGRIRGPESAGLWVEALLRASPVREAPLTTQVALYSAQIELPHRDPADRFIAASAAVHDLTLVTADGQLAAGRGYRILVNR